MALHNIELPQFQVIEKPKKYILNQGAISFVYSEINGQHYETTLWFGNPECKTKITKKDFEKAIRLKGIREVA